MSRLGQYEPLPLDDLRQDREAELEFSLDVEANDSEHDLLVSRASYGTNETQRQLNNGFLSSLFSWGRTRSSPRYELSSLSINRPTTPMASSDGVFTNIPAKPTSSKDVDKDAEEMGEDEWIFMSPEQRSKLPPPKYSRIKRDRAPSYTTEYIPSAFPNYNHVKPRRPKPLCPRINAHPTGSPTLFIVAAVLSAILPLLGFALVYVLTFRTRWKTHASRLGYRTGFGISLFHLGAMIVYIPAAVSTFSASRIPLVLGILWTAFVSIPFGWPMARNASREYIWLRAEERVLLDRLAGAGLDVCGNDVVQEEEESEDPNAYMHIEGTDMRVKDLKKALARARDARLARSLRAAGF